MHYQLLCKFHRWETSYVIYLVWKGSPAPVLKSFRTNINMHEIPFLFSSPVKRPNKSQFQWWLFPHLLILIRVQRREMDLIRPIKHQVEHGKEKEAEWVIFPFFAAPFWIETEIVYSILSSYYVQLLLFPILSHISNENRCTEDRDRSIIHIFELQFISYNFKSHNNFSLFS